MSSNVFMATWVPIDEKLPDPGTTVLISFDDGSVSAYWQKWVWDDGDIHKYVNENMTGYRYAKAWMPMPRPYKEATHVEG